ncbi:erythroid differentiation-related factor 1 [Sergentomyia squamirostris]
MSGKDVKNNGRKDEEEASDSEIKSQAVVKYSNVRMANFSQLQCNTDLNMPPSNWLRNSINFYGMQQAAIHRSGFSSFRMAHMFPDCVGGVDVVCDAEIIKRLLMLPYSRNSSLSLMVHRIGNTLLIDDFDIHKYLLRQSPLEWDWLKRFIYDKIINGLTVEERMFLVANRSRNVLQERRLISKFLYHSLPREKHLAPEDNPPMEAAPLLEMLPGPVLPDPEVEHSVPDPNFSHTFNRSIVWTFEDIRMLIGTDMPIFGGGTRPCISLRLRDMSKPINVLTGIDYWLDNLMCNVPEVVMCYHLDGIVQKYELIKTEDLPSLDNSRFSPKIIKNVAQNILSFLKANATKAGHTYWLFKRPKDDVVKLYDLTTLCMEGEYEPKAERADKNKEEKASADGANVPNPFTIPVAMLLYSVARNMKSSMQKLTNKQAGAIKMLLDNCIKLLPKEKYPQIVVSSHYMLSDLNVPANVEPGSVTFASNSDDSEFEDESLYDEDDSDSDEIPPKSDLISETVAVKNIQETTIANNFKKKNWKHNCCPPALSADVEKRCLGALDNIVAGLKCLKYFRETAAQTNEEEKKQKIRKEADNLNMAKPYQPIPLPYETLTPQPKLINPNDVIPLGWKQQVAAAKKKASKNEDKIAEKNCDVKCWSLHLKLLLLEKAILTYSILAEQAYAGGQFARAFKYTNIAVRCQHVVAQHWPNVAANILSNVIMRIGDCYLQFAKQHDKLEDYLQEMTSISDSDKIIQEFIESDEDDEVKFDFPTPSGSVVNIMLWGVVAYQKALQEDSGEFKEPLVRRIGNCYNEMASDCMSLGLVMLNKLKEISVDELKALTEECQDKCMQSLTEIMARAQAYLSKSVENFESIEDYINLALIYCNKGRYHRQIADILSFRASITGDLFRMETINKKCYGEAFSCYNRALGMLEVRKNNPEMWDILYWELSTSTFILAQHMQDSWDTRCERHQEIMELLQRSLKLCQTHSDQNRTQQYLYRTGQINTRLGMLCGNIVRYQSPTLDEKKKKNMVQLCRFYCEKAISIFHESFHLEECIEVLTDLLEFTNYQLEYVGKIKTLQYMINTLKQIKDVLITCAHASEESLQKLEAQYQNILKNLVKTSIASTSRGPRETEIPSALKQMYSNALKKSDTTEDLKVCGASPEIVYDWKKIDYEGVEKNNYKSENVIPTGIAHDANGKKVFIAVPRFHKGVPYTLTEVTDGSAKNSQISPFSGKPTKELISIYQPVIDECQRLWVLDAGSAEYVEGAPTPQNPAIIAFNLKENNYPEIIRHEFESVTKPLGFGSFAVDVVDPEKCNEVFVYITNFEEHHLYIYDNHKKTSWTVGHDSFKPAKVTKLENSAFEVGIFSVALGERDTSGNRQAYYLSGSSTILWKVDTKFLKTESQTPLDVKKVGDRGQDTDSIALAYDPGSKVIFIAGSVKKQVTCWNTNKPFNADNLNVIYQNDKLTYLTDLSVDSAGDLWFFSNARHPINGTKNPEDDFLLLKVNANDAIKNTKCAN